MIDLIRRALEWARRQFVPVIEPERRRVPAEHRPAEKTTLPVPPMRQPQWYAELRDVEETTLVRLYVVGDGERARRRLEPRWQPLAVSLPWTAAEVY
ncbi:hypothetical protein Q3V23_24875 [Streptomyces sp. VNUA116]|uniref:hypothetical protein n=1 Tax=Streptomyces sp. VNUA116 TaxID=3062449 RepID=UPI002675AA31|nr:hypothetical protein [Streptomyces sp. VNUA116]WKU47033.1 hypothetical protein Q3V23_24875 [Streptomyces sp. VNUA116]